VIKYAIIKDARLFDYLEKKHKEVFSCKKNALENIVRSCSRIKAGVVSQDEREEKGIRTILNFGHTVGHAVEAAAKFKGYTHGEAVALGMLAAADISRKLRLVNDASVERIETLIQRVGLPTNIRNVRLANIVSAHYRDKKFIGSKNRFVLISAIGRTKIVENIPLEVIVEALKKRL
jgi:3-dehydroquinate synthase